MDVRIYSSELPTPRQPRIGGFNARTVSEGDLNAILGQYEIDVLAYQEALNLKDADQLALDTQFKRDALVGVGLARVLAEDDPDTSQIDEYDAEMATKAEEFWTEASRGTTSKSVIWTNLQRLINLYTGSLYEDSNSN